MTATIQHVYPPRPILVGEPPNQRTKFETDVWFTSEFVERFRMSIVDARPPGMPGADMSVVFTTDNIGICFHAQCMIM